MIYRNNRNQTLLNNYNHRPILSIMIRDEMDVVLLTHVQLKCLNLNRIFQECVSLLDFCILKTVRNLLGLRMVQNYLQIIRLTVKEKVV